jgi:hypothetical protein
LHQHHDLDPDAMSSPYFEVEKILKRRIKNGKIQYFLKWKGFPESDNSWEPASNVTPDLIREFERTNGIHASAGKAAAGSRKRSPNSAVELSPPIRKPVCRRTTSAPLVPEQPVATVSDTSVKEEAGLSETATDEEMLVAQDVYRGLEPEKVTGAVVLRQKLFIRTKWTDGGEDLVPAKFANRLFPALVIEFYQSHISLHPLKPHT